jgi:filamentous hemagglutinin family protein
MQAHSRPSSALKTSLTKRQLCLAIAAMLAPGLSYSAPVLVGPNGQGGVTSGSATVVQNGNVTNINQSSQAATINWWSFGSKPSETINFNQPNAAAITLNRVIGNEASVLEGALNAVGKVFLINSNGVLIAKGATINTGGFFASTLNITDDDFNAGRFVFNANGSKGSVINMGTITAKEVGLFGNLVSNQGVITATKGTVALNSGDKITLNFNGDSMVNVTIDEGTLNALVENRQAIYADGGQVIMTAKAADDLLGAQVNNTGLIQARTVDDLKGSIELYAHGGTTTVGGTLDASAPVSGDGGFIETSGDRVRVADGALVTTKSMGGKTGTWLIDPTDFNIVSGSGAQTSSGIGADTLNTNLGNTSVSLTTAAGGTGNGDINVNAAVTWSADTILSLTAANDININASLTATGTNAGLAMNYGGDYHIRTPATYSGTTIGSDGKPVAAQALPGTQYASITLSGSNATLNIQGNAYTVIHNMAQLAAISVTPTADLNTGDLIFPTAGYYALGNNLDASGTTYTAAVVANLNGTFAGLGHTVDGLIITNPSTSTITNVNLGLFGIANAGSPTSTIRDIGITNATITSGSKNVGTLAGTNNGNISNAYSTGGSVTGKTDVGGLVGVSGTGGTTTVNTVSNSYSDVTINGNVGATAVGGLIGATFNTIVTNSHASPHAFSVTTGTNFGGLVGSAVDTTIDRSYATGNIISTTGQDIGGLVGRFSTSGTSNPTGNYSVKNSFAIGDHTGAYEIGGLIGLAVSQAAKISIDNVQATGTQTGNGPGGTSILPRGVGGLIGRITGKSTAIISVTNASAAGRVTNTSTTGGPYFGLGGLVGYMDFGSLDHDSSSATVSGSATSSGVGGLVGRASDSTISNSTGLGLVTGAQQVDGLVGQANNTTITLAPVVTAPQQASAAQTAEAATATQQAASQIQTAQRQSANVIPQSSFGNTPVPIDSQIVFADPNSFSADVKSIVVDGVRFNLDDAGSTDSNEQGKNK